MEQPLNIGEKIREVFEAKKMKLKDFAESVGVARQNIYRIFEKDTIDIELLLQISSVLDHNFLQYYTNGSSGNSYGSVIIPKKGEAETHKEIEQLKSELKLAKKEIDYLTRIIELMEERTKLLIEKNG
ncbi:MAG: helix-turn-helix transcriptional regulator [Sphingobacteriaceae bacterium]|nr:helix-turn-helix transcriptional regulator [Sphingobacteriaceae bacterium]